MARLIALLAGVLGLLLGIVSPANATSSADQCPATAYSYNDPRDRSSDDPTAQVDRGPPAALNRDTTYGAVARWSRGALACSGHAVARAVTSYDDTARLVLVALATGTATGQAEGYGRALPAFVRSGVAAKSVDEVEDIGHAGLRHQFPNTLKGKSQFYDDINLGDLASRTKGMDGFLQTNGNTRYVLRNPGGVGVDRTTGLPTDVFPVVRRPDGSVVTMFPGTSPKG